VRVDVLPCDVSDDEARQQLVADVEATGMFVAGVCNNAGFGTFGRFDGLPLEREMEMVHVNVVALHHLTGAFLWPMVERGEGAILNVASVAAFQPLPGFATYAATKAFVQTFSEALHAELDGTGVSVTTLCPGPVATEFGDVAGVSTIEDMLPGVLRASAQDVAIAAIRGMTNGRRTVVPGIVTKALAAGGRFTPRSVLLPAAKKSAGSRLANP
jgi:short-subunit dehydrogenase